MEAFYILYPVLMQPPAVELNYTTYTQNILTFIHHMDLYCNNLLVKFKIYIKWKRVTGYFKQAKNTLKK